MCLFGVDFPGCGCNKAADPLPGSFSRSGVFSLVHIDQRLPLSSIQCAPGSAQPDTLLQGTHFQCSCCQSGSFKLKTLRLTMCQCLWKTWLNGFINARKWNGKCQYVYDENVSVHRYWRMAFHRELLPLLFSSLRMPSFFNKPLSSLQTVQDPELNLSFPQLHWLQ